jgi:hypothetical protein
MQWSLPSHKAEGRKESVNSENMVAMEVAYKYMIDFSKPDVAFPELHLGSFTTVYQKKALICIKQMSARISF